MTDLRAQIAFAAGEAGLDRRLVAAVVQVESDGNEYAWNPEGHYRWFWNVYTKTPFRVLTDVERGSKYPPTDFPCLAGDRDQEWWGQSASWGLMQVMGAVARESGFKGKYFTSLCRSEVGVEYGCRHLSRLFLLHGNWPDAIAAYNGGSPRRLPSGQYEPLLLEYVTKVARELHFIYPALQQILMPGIEI